MKVGVTGSGGYLGRHLVRALCEAGHRVVSLSRSDGFQLERISSLPELDCLIHAAYDFKAFGASEIQRINVAGSIRLFQTAKSLGINRCIFISSMAAFSGCKSLYGKGKLAVEKCVLELGGCVVRPGTIYGAKGGGVVGTLQRISLLPVIFLPAGGRQKLFLIHIDDLCKAVSLLVDLSLPLPNAPMNIANPTPVMLSQLILQLAGGHRPIVSIPENLVFLILRSAEILLRGSSPLRSDSLESLLNPNPSPDFENTLSLRFRPFQPIV